MYYRNNDAPINLSPDHWGRAGVHGHLAQILSPWEGVLILFDMQGAPKGRATLFTANLKTKQRSKQRD